MTAGTPGGREGCPHRGAAEGAPAGGGGAGRLEVAESASGEEGVPGEGQPNVTYQSAGRAGGHSSRGKGTEVK